MHSKTWSRAVLICAVLMLAPMLCACGALQTKASAPVRPDAELLTYCPPTLPDPKSSLLPDLMANHLASAEQYHLCRQKHHDLVEAVTPPANDVHWWQFWKIYW